MVGQRVHDLAIHKGQEPVALVHQRDPDAQRGEQAGVFEADDPRADDRQSTGEVVEVQNIIADEDAVAVKGNVRVLGGNGADGDHDIVGCHVAVAASPHVGEPHRVRVEKGRLRRDDLHPVAHELGADDVNLVGHDMVGAEEQVGDGDVLLDSVGRPVQPALAVARQVQDGLAQRLAGDRSRVDADAAHHRLALHNRHALAQLGRLDRRPLPRWPRSNHHQVVLRLLHVNLPPPPQGVSFRGRKIAKKVPGIKRIGWRFPINRSGRRRSFASHWPDYPVDPIYSTHQSILDLRRMFSQ